MTPSRNFLLSFPVTLALAALSWHLVEKPFLQIKKRLSSRLAEATGKAN